MNNIILIGMPGAGKSTIGVVLAKRMGYKFIDSDLLIQEKEQMLLSDIISNYGINRFNQIENSVNYSINTEKSVIATGGSVIYGREAMMHLKSIGHVIYLSLPLEEIEKRVGNLQNRGVAIRNGETLSDLYEQRVPLYEKYADITIKCENTTITDTVMKIANMFI